jgi:predicted MFS family arabinose efflux permease
VAIFLGLVVTPFALLLSQESSPAVPPQSREFPSLAAVGSSSENFTLTRALRTSVFWVFGASTALFALASSGLGLFNEAVLAERGFDQKTYHTFLAVTTFAGLIGQLFCGWSALRWALQGLLGIAMLLYAIALAMLPLVHGAFTLWTAAVLIGLTGGFVTVIFFAIWSHAFGRKHLGRIQGAAQLLTVLASALGPVLFAGCVSVTGSYAPLLLMLAVVVLGLSVAAWRVPLPGRATAQDAEKALYE